MRSLRKLLAPRFDILHADTVMPAGHQGVLRVTNSPKLNAMLGRVIAPARLERAKERMGLGYNLIVLARKRH
jgi:hypothetical protein